MSHMGHITQHTLARTHGGYPVALLQYEPVLISDRPRTTSNLIECRLVARVHKPLAFVPAERVNESAGRIEVDEEILNRAPLNAAEYVAPLINAFNAENGFYPRVVIAVRKIDGGPATEFVRQLWPAADEAGEAA